MFSAVWRSDSHAAVVDELAEYLALPQIKYKTEEDDFVWWRENEAKFPNVAVMARQYLGAGLPGLVCIGGAPVLPSGDRVCS